MRALVLWMLAMAPAIAGAQLDEARRQLDDADFARAVRAFDRAEQRESLDRADLVSLYEGRAMALWALGQEERARRDLRALGSLDPEHTLPAEAPPELQRAFAETAHVRIALEATWDDRPGHTTLAFAIQGDDAGLVRSVRAHVRREGGDWVTEESREVEIDLGPGDRVEAWAEAVGPGDAVLARIGSELAPLRHGEGAAASTTSTEAVGEDATPIWIGVGVGAGVVAAIILIAIVAASIPNDATQPRPPMVVGF